MGLGEVLEAIGTVEPWRYSTTELMDVLPALSDAIHTLEAMRVALVAELDKHGVPGGLGATSTATWLANRTSLSPGESNRILTLGVALDAHPDIAAAYQAKLINADAARLIVAFLEKPPPGMPVEAVDSVRAFLLDAAQPGDLRELRVHIARLRETFDTDDTPASEDTDRNEFYASTTLNGRMAVKGDFDAETGEMLLAALSPLSTPRPQTKRGRTLGPRRNAGRTGSPRFCVVTSTPGPVPTTVANDHTCTCTSKPPTWQPPTQRPRRFPTSPTTPTSSTCSVARVWGGCRGWVR